MGVDVILEKLLNEMSSLDVPDANVANDMRRHEYFLDLRVDREYRCRA